MCSQLLWSLGGLQSGSLNSATLSAHKTLNMGSVEFEPGWAYTLGATFTEVIRKTSTGPADESTAHWECKNVPAPGNQATQSLIFPPE